MKSKKLLNTNHAPLLCWDIFMEGYHRRMDLADDLKIMHKIMIQNKWLPQSFSLDNTLMWQNKVIVITDTNINIVHATENLFAMNGYKPQEVIGKSPKIFQGEATTSEERKLIKAGVESQKPFDAIITNHKKDGSIYKCHIEGYPIFNKHGNLVNFVAIESAA